MSVQACQKLCLHTYVYVYSAIYLLKSAHIYFIALCCARLASKTCACCRVCSSANYQLHLSFVWRFNLIKLNMLIGNGAAVLCSVVPPNCQKRRKTLRCHLSLLVASSLLTSQHHCFHIAQARFCHICCLLAAE